MPVLKRQASIKCSLYPKQDLSFNNTFVRGEKNTPQTLNFIDTLKFITLVHDQKSTTNN